MCFHQMSGQYTYTIEPIKTMEVAVDLGSTHHMYIYFHIGQEDILIILKKKINDKKNRPLGGFNEFKRNFIEDTQDFERSHQQFCQFEFVVLVE